MQPGLSAIEYAETELRIHVSKQASKFELRLQCLSVALTKFVLQKS